MDKKNGASVEDCSSLKLQGDFIGCGMAGKVKEGAESG